jgi:hypothetical protein
MNNTDFSRSTRRYLWLPSGRYQLQVAVDTEAGVLAVSEAEDMEVAVLEAVDLVVAMVVTEAVVMEVVLAVSEVAAMGVDLVVSEVVNMVVA